MKSSEEGNSTEEEEERYQVFKVQLTQVRQYLIVALLLILAFGVVLLYRWNRDLIVNIPERCLIIVFSCTFALISYTCSGDDPVVRVDVHAYFLFILPGFIFHTAWSLPRRCRMLKTTATMQKHLPLEAVGLFCTVVPVLSASINAALIYMVHSYHGITYLKSLVVALIYVPVDLPPGQLASLFSDWEFGHVVYLCHAGETLSSYLQSTLLLHLITSLAIHEQLSKISNATTTISTNNSSIVTTIVTDYNHQLDDVSNERVSQYEVGKIVVRWLVSVTVAIVTGVLCGHISYLYTKLYKMTYHNVPIVEPLMVICLFYLSYIVASIFGFGGPLAGTTCALYMALWTEPRTSKRSRHVIRGCLRITTSIAEWFACLSVAQHLFYHKSDVGAILFDSLGNWSFAISIFIFSFATRIVLIYSITSCFNVWYAPPTTRQISTSHINPDNKIAQPAANDVSGNSSGGFIISGWEKFAIFFSGIRGPLSFWLAIYVTECFDFDLLSPKMQQGVFTAVLVAVTVTTFVQGPTIKAFSACLLGPNTPFVQKGQKKPRRRKKYIAILTSAITDPITAGITAIASPKRRMSCKCQTKPRKTESLKQRRDKMTLMTEQYELIRKLNMMLLVDSIQSVNEVSCITDYDPLQSVGSSLISYVSTDFQSQDPSYESTRRRNPILQCTS
ncbi:Na(+)/H(+) exchanger beta-like [Convolutriloba macropyga]|uniref:Na(+)/H(+) exchanger beta-like n=1 Tax=Convolutriloba macropyga TaxID=536237 RepID=UPI003F5243F1